MPKGLRLDLALVERGFFPTRQQAQVAIMAGVVQIDGRTAAKASDSVQESNALAVVARNRFVGLGGEKLARALAHFALDATDTVALDLGASTGRSTDSLPQTAPRKASPPRVPHPPPPRP